MKVCLEIVQIFSINSSFTLILEQLLHLFAWVIPTGPPLQCDFFLEAFPYFLLHQVGCSWRVFP